MAYDLDLDDEDPIPVLGDLPNLCGILAQMMRDVGPALLVKSIVSRAKEIKREKENMDCLKNQITLMKKSLRRKPLKFIRKLQIKGIKMVKRDVSKWKCLTLWLWKLKFIALGKVVHQTLGWDTIFKAELRLLTHEASERDTLVIESMDELQCVDYIVKRPWGFNGTLIVNSKVIGGSQARVLDKAARNVDFLSIIESLPEQRPLAVGGARRQLLNFAADVRKGAYSEYTL